MKTEVNRCRWANVNETYQKYHDQEWGVPLHDEHKLFAMLILEGQQAGLSWWTILSRRDSFYQAFDDFDPHQIAAYDESKIESLMLDPGIIRNRLKIKSVIGNA